MNKKKTVLVVDGGGRGAALVHKYAQSSHVGRILAVPGNDLMKINIDKPVQIYHQFKTTSVKEILEICQREKVDLVDVAQDNAVEAGLVDVLLKNGVVAVGPLRDAGEIEWSKNWARELLKKAKVSQPDYQTFTDLKKAQDYIKNQNEGMWFIKASGLAEGKGALSARSRTEAIEKIKELKKFGPAAEKFLIEQWLVGEEFSTFVISDGNSYQFIGDAQDHKRVDDFDQRENTGGMGCSSPPLVLTQDIKKQINEVVGKTLGELRRIGRPYQGILYLGGMIVPGKTRAKVYVIEFNARWGDPEAQALVPGIKNDLFEVSLAVFKGRLDEIKIKRDNLSRVVVAGAARGYPSNYQEVKGKQIYGLDEAQKVPGVCLYGAGVKKEGGKYFANGGRLFYLVGEGKTVVEARQKVYQAMSLVSIEGNNLHYRTDIGWRDVQRLRQKI